MFYQAPWVPRAGLEEALGFPALEACWGALRAWLSWLAAVPVPDDRARMESAKKDKVALHCVRVPECLLQVPLHGWLRMLTVCSWG